MKPKTSDNLGIKSARVFFIYSFLCNNDSTPTRELPCKLVDDLKILDKGMPKPRSSSEGLSAYIALDLAMAYRILDPLKGCIGTDKHHSDSLDVRVDPLLRLFSNGGSLTLKVVLDQTAGEDRRISVDDVHKLHHLAPLVGNRQKYRFRSLTPVAPEGCSLYELFKDLITKETKRWSDAEAVQSGQQRDYRLLCTDHLASSADAESPKMPWAITLLELGNKAALDAFCGDLPRYAEENINPAEAKAKAIRPYIPLVAPLLYRAPDYKHFTDRDSLNFALEPTYYKTYHELNSLNVEARLYVQMSRRSILCICADRREYPASYFLPSLLDMCETIHTRWYSLIILHKVLDEKLGDFTRGANLKSPTFTSRTGEVRRKLEDIVSIVATATACLEDPTIFTVSGDAIRNLHEEMNKIFRLELLTKRALDKLHLLEQTYHHGLELGWSQELLSDGTQNANTAS